MTVQEVDSGATAVWPPPPDGDEPVERPGPSPRSILLRAVPALLLALLLGWWLEPWVGVAVIVAATVITVTSLASPTAARGIERVLGAVSHWVGRILSAVVLTLVFAVIFVPVGLVRRVLRRDLLATGAPPPDSTWLARWGWTERRLPERSYASEQDLLGGRREGRLLWGIGVVAVLVLADLSIGTLLVDPPSDAPPPVDEGQGEASAIPALAGLAYVPQLFAEQFSAESGQYDALLGWRLEDTDGEHLNIVGEERVSTTTSAPGDPVVVWFFGGSAMYGFGQRDGHTIPSELVRLAEDDGIALEAHNFGTPAYVNWQGVDLFARLLTEREAPDVAVFYDGYNDLSMQLVDGPITEPSHVLARVHEERLTAPPPEVEATSWRDLRDWWADHSAVTNLWRRLEDRFGGGDEADVQLTEAEASAVPADVDVTATEAATADLLARGRDLAGALGEAYGVEVQFWFQPTLFTKGAVEGEEQLPSRAANRTPAWEPLIAALRAGFPPEVVDLADSLDGQPDPLFWDTVHTNEAGARLVAEAAWPTLREAVEQTGS